VHEDPSYRPRGGPRRIVVGISGASGALYSKRVMELLAAAGIEIHLCVTSLGRRLLFDELDMRKVDPDALTGGRGDRVVLYGDNDLGARIASGSFLHDGMVVVPCSSNTLGAVASGITANLLQRAAAVTLKERRRLVLAHRETPLTHIDIQNMERLSASGAIVAPLNPGLYLLPKTVDEIVDFLAGKMLDLLQVDHDLDIRWNPRGVASGSGGDAADTD